MPPAESSPHAQLQVLCLGSGSGASHVYGNAPSTSFALVLGGIPVLLIGAGGGTVKQCLKFFGAVPQHIFIPNNRTHWAGELPVLLSVEAAKGRRITVYAETAVLHRLQSQRLGELAERMKQHNQNFESLAEFVHLSESYAERFLNGLQLTVHRASTTELSYGIVVSSVLGARGGGVQKLVSFSGDSTFDTGFYEKLSECPVAFVDARAAPSEDHACFKDVYMLSEERNSRLVRQDQSHSSSSDGGASSPPTTTYFIAQFGDAHNAPAPQLPFVQVCSEGKLVTLPANPQAVAAALSHLTRGASAELLPQTTTVIIQPPQQQLSSPGGRRGGDAAMDTSPVRQQQQRHQQPFHRGQQQQQQQQQRSPPRRRVGYEQQTSSSFTRNHHTQQQKQQQQQEEEENGRLVMHDYASFTRNERKDPLFVEEAVAQYQRGVHEQEQRHEAEQQAARYSNVRAGDAWDRRPSPQQQQQRTASASRRTGSAGHRQRLASPNARQSYQQQEEQQQKDRAWKARLPGEYQKDFSYPSSNPRHNEPKKVFLFNNEEKGEEGKLVMIQALRTMPQLKNRCAQVLKIKPVGELHFPTGALVTTPLDIQHNDSIVVTKHGGVAFDPFDLPTLLKRKLHQQQKHISRGTPPPTTTAAAGGYHSQQQQQQQQQHHRVENPQSLL